ncbi:hypothetical protein EVA_10633 [gut metagenome]|uniref:Uncharacterized protein n=1 Tax=gut metagenome TaxID=749906 RepID=J9CMD5_9ZZZZ
MHDSGIDTSDLRAFINGVKDRLKKEGRKPKDIEKAVIALRLADGMLYYGYIPRLERFVQFCDENGLKIKHVLRRYNDIKDVTNLLYAEGNEAFALSIGIATNKYLDYYPDDAWVYYNEGFQFAYDAMHKPRLEKSDSKAKEVSKINALLRDALADVMREIGIEVITDNKEAQRVLDRENGIRMSAKQKRALKTASLGNNPRSLTVVSSATGAKILNNLDKLSNKLNDSATQPKTFIGDLADAIEAGSKGSSSQYATFETINGEIITIRIANHNASTQSMDNAGQNNAISIVITPKSNNGILNDGNAHVVEFYYNSLVLRRAEGNL